MYACDHHYTCCHHHTTSGEYTCRGLRPTWIAPCRIAPSNCVRANSHICTLSHLQTTQTQIHRAQCFAHGTEPCELLKFTSHVSVCLTNARSLVCGLHQTRFRENISGVDTWCCETFVVELFLIVRIRIQHIKFSCEYERTFGITSFTQLNLFMVPAHF